MSQNLEGYWYKEDKEGNYVRIEVLEVTGNIARAVGQNIDITVLQRDYKRQQAIAPDPFASEKVSITDPTIVVKSDVAPASSQTINVAQSLPAPAIAETFNAMSIQAISEKSPQHKFIHDACKLTSASSSLIDVKISFDLPCNLMSILKSASAFDIDNQIIAEVLTALIIDTYSKELSNSIELSIVESLSTPAASDTNTNTK